MSVVVGVTMRVVTDKRNERRDALDQRWITLLERVGVKPVLIPNTLRDCVEYFRNIGANALLLTGGNDLCHEDGPSGEDCAPERDRTEKALLEEAARNDIPVLGVCRGFQMINQHFGGVLSGVTGHVACYHDVEFTIGGLDHYFKSKTASVNSYHNFGIKSGYLAEPLAPAAASGDVVEAAIHRDHPILGIMWHPERENPFKQEDLALISNHLIGRSHLNIGGSE